MSRKYKGPTFGPFLFLVNKPKGITSFDVIRKFKKSFGPTIGKIGHFGTLDPFATGLLVVGIGGATRLSQYSDDFHKEYIATGILGLKSPTGDMTCDESELIKSQNDEIIKESEIESALKSFLGEYYQSPHTYSAAKHEGKPLYEWAREGVNIKKDAVKREIFEIELLEYNYPEVKFRVVVSHGTYIRVLMEDLAHKLSTFGLLKELDRTRVGHLSLDQSLNFKDVESLSPIDIIKFARPITQLLQIEHIELDDAEAKKYQNGMRIDTQVGEGFGWVHSKAGYHGLCQVKQNIIMAKVNYLPSFDLEPDVSIVQNLKKNT